MIGIQTNFSRFKSELGLNLFFTKNFDYGTTGVSSFESSECCEKHISTLDTGRQGASVLAVCLRVVYSFIWSRVFGLCNLVDMSSPLPFPSSDDVDMNKTPDRKSSLPRGSSSVTPIRRRQDDLSRPGTVARRALAVPSSSRGSPNRGIGLS